MVTSVVVSVAITFGIFEDDEGEEVDDDDEGDEGDTSPSFRTPSFRGWGRVICTVRTALRLILNTSNITVFP